MKIVQNQKLTVADVFETHFAEYLKTHKVSEQQRKAVTDIMRCQTIDCGMHEVVCTDCGTIDLSYNSCRNRHCPNCQNATVVYEAGCAHCDVRLGGCGVFSACD